MHRHKRHDKRIDADLNQTAGRFEQILNAVAKSGEKIGTHLAPAEYSDGSPSALTALPG